MHITYFREPPGRSVDRIRSKAKPSIPIASISHTTISFFVGGRGGERVGAVSPMSAPTVNPKASAMAEADSRPGNARPTS